MHQSVTAQKAALYRRTGRRADAAAPRDAAAWEPLRGMHGGIGRPVLGRAMRGYAEALSSYLAAACIAGGLVFVWAGLSAL